MSEFSLVCERWIPCIDLHGNRVEYGIRDTLAKAHELREICDDSPLVTVAIHRMLLALLYRAFAGPTDLTGWKAIWQNGRFEGNQQIDEYLKKWHDRFWLFDDQSPIMQVAGLDLSEYKKDGTVKLTKGLNKALDGAMRLAKEAPDIGGRILFDHRMGTEKPEYPCRVLIRMLLANQSFAGTGIPSAGKIGDSPINPYKPFPNDKEKKVGCTAAPGVEGLILWLQGDNLFQTMMLNLVPQEVCPSDLPAWEDDHIVQSAINSWQSPVSFSGPVQRFAPLSRFVRLVDKKSIFFTNGLKASSDSNDPMKAYVREANDKPWSAKRLQEQKAAWRDAHSLFAVGVGNCKAPEALNLAARANATVGFNANVVGMATKKDKALLWRHERMPVPAALLDDVNLIERLGALIQNAEQAAVELDNRTRRVAKLYLSPSAEDRDGRKPDEKDVRAMADDIDPRPAYWSRLERHFFDLLENLPDDWDTDKGEWKPDDQQHATRTWREQVKREARRALEESIRSLGTTARAIQAVARVRTDFNDDDLKPPAQRAA